MYWSLLWNAADLGLRRRAAGQRTSPLAAWENVVDLQRQTDFMFYDGCKSSDERASTPHAQYPGVNCMWGGNRLYCLAATLSHVQYQSTWPLTSMRIPCCKSHCRCMPNVTFRCYMASSTHVCVKRPTRIRHRQVRRRIRSRQDGFTRAACVE
jgi:hypothetical protein